ncbi:MAG: hypothetical protein A3B81_03505 [Candidatus Muproteobacteria bacterium RIFCSPHIGHO2_02_FULL_65_16]|uniref:Uncharacterized protein n=1 Tax=Candidatus Muproteobacteria bacterium RIFCSPHIGHO2_02_FULL_65_16 TaxID=1817766 RepID=A0A1F6U2Z3_9PROT|nr:MAG: hypothetical protein A3B81_03505 [Candidatus Muproteobacteria bacterium RIFCSPHIGHO2_02_FULL_65_16]
MNAAQWVTTNQEFSITDSKSGVNSFSNVREQEVLFYTAFPKRDYSVVVSLPERKTIFVQDLGDARLALRELAISIEQWPNSVTAYSYDTGEFAFADDELTAIDELKALIVDLYFLLKEEQNNLGPLPLKYWNFLKSVIQEK